MAIPPEAAIAGISNQGIRYFRNNFNHNDGAKRLPQFVIRHSSFDIIYLIWQ